MFKLTPVCSALVLLPLLGAATLARAQSGPTAEGAEGAATTQVITVTARKREERGLDVPASLNVFGNDDLQRMGIVDLTQLQQVTPGLAISGYGARISLRGVGNNVPYSGADPSTAVNFDGVYIPRQQMALFNLYDANRVEVLKGPQGTLYGRNATGGVINVLTRDPRAGTSAEGFLGAGSYGLRSAQVVGNFGTAEGGLRVGLDYAKDDGYTKNLTPGARPLDNVDYLALRAKGVFSPASNVRVKLTGQALSDKGTTGMGFSNNPATDNYASAFPEGYQQDIRHVRVDAGTRRKQDGFIGAANVEVDLGTVTLRSITGVVDYRYKEVLDTDGSGVFIEVSDATAKSRQYSQEFQLLGSNAQIDWTLGLYASHEKAEDNGLLTDQDYPEPPPYEFSQRAASVSGRSTAVFGAATYRLSQQFSATLGARYTSESKRGSAAGRVFGTPWQGDAAVDAKAFTPKLELEFKPSRDVLYYASVGKGFKSGGINAARPVATFKPENIVALEIGTKQIVMDGKLDLAAAVFHYDYKNLQLRTIEFSPGPTAVVANVAKAPITGAELSAAFRLTREFSADLALAWLDAPLQNFVPRAGSPVLNTQLPLTPKNTANLGLEFKTGIAGGTLSTRVEYNHQSGVVFAALANPAIENRGAVGLVNANARYTLAGGKTYISLIGRNLGNKTYLADRFFYNGFADLQSYAPPRQVQLRVGKAF
jgi:iron complex outermembrane receptor protein